MEEKEVKNIAEYLEPEFDEELSKEFEEKIDIKEVLNKEIVIHNYSIQKSEFGKDRNFMTLRIEIGEKKGYINVGSNPLMEQMRKAEEKNIEFPVKATIIEKQSSTTNNTYYTFKRKENEK